MEIKEQLSYVLGNLKGMQNDNLNKSITILDNVIKEINQHNLGIVCVLCGANIDAGENHKPNCGETDDDDVIEK